jgi:hypothetical protein
MERARGVRAAARSAANPAIARSNDQQNTVTVPEQEVRRVTKRKRGNDANLMSRKKVALDVAPVRARYEEPKGSKKSRRIAGKAADPAGPVPHGQYVRADAAEDNSSTSSTSSPPALRSESPAVLDPPATFTRDTAEERTPRRAPATRQTAHAIHGRSNDFLKTLATTVSSHKIVRRLAHGQKTFFGQRDELKYAPGGLVDLEAKIRSMERDGVASTEDLQVIRDRRAKRERELEGNDDTLRRLKRMKGDLDFKHGLRNERIYDFIDITRGEVKLECLPAEFWTAFDRCCEAYTARKDIELEVHEAEEDQRKIFYAFGDQIADAV